MATRFFKKKVYVVLLDIIDDYNRNKANNDKKNIAELTDYIQNYSDMTFNDYKKLKLKARVNINKLVCLIVFQLVPFIMK